MSSPILTVILGVVAFGLVVYLTVRQYQRWKKKKEGKEED